MIIYKTTCLITGKIYIGKDSKNNSEYIGSGINLKKDIKKFGKQNFKKEILEYCDSKKQLNEREIFWIKELNACNSEIGYNLSNGGDGGDTFTNNPRKEEIRKKKSKILKGKKRGIFSKEWTSKMSKSRMGYQNSLGHIPSKKWKEEHSKRMIGNKNALGNKGILQFSLTGELIKEWKSTIQIKKELGFFPSCISKCCNGISKQSYGYKWLYK